MAADVPSFTLQVRPEGDGVRVMPRGELDLATAPEMEAEILPALAQGRDVILDLSELTFMDSTGVRTIVTARQAATESGARLLVVRPPSDSAVSRVIEISGIAEALGIAEDA